VPHDGSRRHALLLDEIVGQGRRRARILAVVGCAILGKIGDRFEGEASIGDLLAEG
jgi:hypothetical protein